MIRAIRPYQPRRLPWWGYTLRSAMIIAAGAIMAWMFSQLFEQYQPLHPIRNIAERIAGATCFGIFGVALFLCGLHHQWWRP